MINDAGVSPSGSTIQRHAQTWLGGQGLLAEYELALFVARQLVSRWAAVAVAWKPS